MSPARTLECDRLRVHRNLVASLIIRFVVMLVLTEPFVSNRQTSYRDVVSAPPSALYADRQTAVHTHTRTHCKTVWLSGLIVIIRRRNIFFIIIIYYLSGRDVFRHRAMKLEAPRVTP